MIQLIMILVIVSILLWMIATTNNDHKNHDFGDTIIHQHELYTMFNNNGDKPIASSTILVESTLMFLSLITTLGHENIRFTINEDGVSLTIHNHPKAVIGKMLIKSLTNY